MKAGVSGLRWWSGSGAGGGMEATSHRLPVLYIKSFSFFSRPLLFASQSTEACAGKCGKCTRWNVFLRFPAGGWYTWKARESFQDSHPPVVPLSFPEHGNKTSACQCASCLEFDRFCFKGYFHLCDRIGIALLFAYSSFPSCAYTLAEILSISCTQYTYTYINHETSSSTLASWDTPFLFVAFFLMLLFLLLLSDSRNSPPYYLPPKLFCT